jgi:hypothetical protein
MFVVWWKQILLLSLSNVSLCQNLRLALPAAQQQESVHFCMIPEPDQTLIHPEIEATVVKLQNVVELARAARLVFFWFFGGNNLKCCLTYFSAQQHRDRRTLPVKTPLACLHVVHSNPTVLEGLVPFLPYIRDELNVREVRSRFVHFLGGKQFQNLF